MNSLANGTLDIKYNFYTICQSLSPIQTILLFRNRIGIPSLLKSELIDIAHEGHQGLVRTKHSLHQNILVAWS